MGQNDYENARQMNRVGGECLEKGDLKGALDHFSEALKLLPEDQAESKARLHSILSRGRPLEDDGPRSTSFKTYLRGELETYSDRN